ncbi:F-box/kelch-repeat protein At3g23880-like [Prosopis cineraria]|uniref:F-box/kelch-repeat protein At3g23880-like n=1 Tax=Prosopis cineraria TaxID=364024 RepID=UPI0024105949|nr:F-box/kelch-repeat protein At3g23880-like [Prosopis cineraria]
MNGSITMPSPQPLASINETIRGLFIRLPVKSLILLRSGCKPWSNLLRSSSFVLNHLHYHSEKNPLLIIQRFHWNQKSSGLELFLFDIQSKKIREFHVPRVTDSDMGFKIVGSCNGLMCVCHYSHDPSSCLFLWNPATRQIRRIPEYSNALLPHKASPYCLLGFGYNTCDEDYEVIRVYSCVGTHAIRIERYSLNSGFWEEVEYSNHHGATVNGHFLWIENSVTVKRKMFWVAMTAYQRFRNEFIVSYDAENKVLRKMSVPDSDNLEVSKKLTEYKESLGVLVFSESATMDRCLDFWVYDDKNNDFDLWIKVKTVRLSSTMDRPMGVWKDEIFIASGNVIHAVRSGLGALLPSAQVADDYCYVLLNYAESLVSVNNGGNRNGIDLEDE